MEVQREETLPPEVEIFAGFKHNPYTNKELELMEKKDSQLKCDYCDLQLFDISDLYKHCKTSGHQTKLFTDDGKKLRIRTALEKKTNAFEEEHGWNDNPTSPNSNIVLHLPDVKEHKVEKLNLTMMEKCIIKTWIFVFESKKMLGGITLLENDERKYFTIKRIVTTKNGPEDIVKDWKIENVHEWIHPDNKDEGTDKSKIKTPENEEGNDKSEGETAEPENEEITYLHTIYIKFHSDVFGTFLQSILFDFNTGAKLARHLSVDVVQPDLVLQYKQLKKDYRMSSTRWDCEGYTIVPATSLLAVSEHTVNMENALFSMCKVPKPEYVILENRIQHKERLSTQNYRTKMSNFLAIEEMARYEEIAKFNVRTVVKIKRSYILTGDDTVMKYAPHGELFAEFKLSIPGITEDTPEGRLVLDSCIKVLIFRIQTWDEKIDLTSSIHEAYIENKTVDALYIRLSSACVSRSRIHDGMTVLMEVQFRLNRIQFALWSYGLKRLTDLSLVFPKLEISKHVKIPRISERRYFCHGLNKYQQQAVAAISAPLSLALPPIVIIGPYGSGKTLTLAESAICVLQQPSSRVLICTHSNSAADIYIKDYLHKYLVNGGNKQFRPLRVYHTERKATTVNETVLKYCVTITSRDGTKSFQMPSMMEVKSHRLVVTTLSSAVILSQHLKLQKGYFTHILIDEVAQAVEAEVLIPLSLASKRTRLAYAGDHMQLEPEIYSNASGINKLDLSLLGRLDSSYPEDHPCKIILRDNYRSNRVIVEFTAKFFYPYQFSYHQNDGFDSDKKLIKFYPLTFFSSFGKDRLDSITLSYNNDSEVYEITYRILELKCFWPEMWGDFESNVGVLAPYGSQVYRLRSELRRVGLNNVSVERVRNVQGKQFRAVFLSTVRTRASCVKITGEPETKKTYGFLSDQKLLNTAMSRAQSMICVVGDPLTLLTIGDCKSIWHSFLEECEKFKSLHGVTIEEMDETIANLELKKQYVLNPQAENFVPRSQRQTFSPPKEAIHVLHPLQLSNQIGPSDGPRMMIPQPNCVVIPLNVIPNQILPPYPQQPQQMLYPAVYRVPGMVPLMVPRYSPQPQQVIPFIADNNQMMALAFTNPMIQLPHPYVLSNSSPVNHRSNSSDHGLMSSKTVGAGRSNKKMTKRDGPKVDATNVPEQKKNNGPSAQNKKQAVPEKKPKFSKVEEKKVNEAAVMVKKPPQKAKYETKKVEAQIMNKVVEVVPKPKVVKMVPTAKEVPKVVEMVATAKEVPKVVQVVITSKVKDDEFIEKKMFDYFKTSIDKLLID